MIAVWLAIAAVMVRFDRAAIVAGDYGDTDDWLRLQEMRDWLGGQGWFDVHQHRIGIGEGLAMHWSRLVDVPIALFAAPLGPLIGRHAAEAVAVTAVPLLTLAVMLAALTRVVRRLFPASPAAPAIGAFLVAVAPPVLTQIHPTRIDHHGWQIALATIALAALVGPARRRAGIVAGLATALYLNISLEGLPFAVATAGVLALGWAFGMERQERLLGFLAALALGSAVLLAATAPLSRFGLPWCDVILPAHVLALGVATLGCAAIARLSAPAARIGGLVVVGAGAAAALCLAAPICATGPFGMLDPLSRLYWYDNVVEGLPIWRQRIAVAPIMVGFPLIGLVGALRAWRGAAEPEQRRRWLMLLMLGLATLVTGMLVRRAGGIAHVVAVPGALALILSLKARIGLSRVPPVRVVGTTAAILLLSPLMPACLGVLLDRAPPARPAPKLRCGLDCALAQLAAMPPASILAGLDMGPELIARTPHRVYSAGYHRSGRPMTETVRAFLMPPGVAHRLVAARRLDHVLIDPRSGEAEIYRKAAPDGLMARLLAGRAPSWLRPVAIGGPLKLWRVVG